MNTFNIGKEFSTDPIGRYRSDSDSSGELFREEYLKPKLEKLAKGEKLKIILDDGVEAYGSSFLVEGFAGLVKHGYFEKEELINMLEFEFKDEDFDFYANKIKQYIKEAKYNSVG